MIAGTVSTFGICEGISVGFGSGLLIISRAVRTKPPIKIEAGNKNFFI